MSAKNVENAKGLSDDKAAREAFGGLASACSANSTMRLAITVTESSDKWMMFSSRPGESRMGSDALASSRDKESSSSQCGGLPFEASHSATIVRANSMANRRQFAERASVWDSWAR